MTRPTRARRVVWFGLAFASLMAIVACAPEARYRVLSFVFDGVPPPPGVVVEAESPVEKGRRAVAGFNGGLSNLMSNGTFRKPPVIRSVHQPVAEKKCQECHDRSAGFDQMPFQDPRLCDKCHEEKRITEGWNHGPVNLGTCIPCHVPHKSLNEHLLSQPIPDLCLMCHEEDLNRPEEYHEIPNVNECVACHDPHRMF